MKTKPKILLGICSPLVVVLIFGGVSIYSINTIVETDKWVDHMCGDERRFATGVR